MPDSSDKQVEQIPVSRTLHEWYDYIQAERAKGVSWRTRVWWMRQWIYRVGTAERLRIWWENARSNADKYGSLVEQWTGKSRSVQLMEMARLKLKHDVPPEYYYTYKLYRGERAEKAGRFVRHNRQVRLLQYLIEHVYPEDRPTGDKRTWHRWAEEHDVPVPRVLATFEDGKLIPWHWDGKIRSLPARDLFSKWTNLWRGIGAECWLNRNGAYENIQDTSVRLDAAALVSHLKEKSLERPVILQERVRNHPSIQRFTSGGLATSRLVTGRFPNEEPQPIIATLKIPTNGAIVDSGSTGKSLASHVDISSGTLGPGISAAPHPDGDLLHTHPNTGAAITGTTYPHFDDLLDLAVSTHSKLPGIAFVGWDVAITEDGPMIIEPNNGWGASGAEKAPGIPLADTLYQPMYDAWMQLYVNGTRV